jgi:hypothetical protein
VGTNALQLSAFAEVLLPSASADRSVGRFSFWGGFPGSTASGFAARRAGSVQETFHVGLGRLFIIRRFMKIVIDNFKFHDIIET